MLGLNRLFGPPSLDIRSDLWPKNVRANVTFVPDLYGSCSAEAVSYLRGIALLYDRIAANDVVVFTHAHNTAWHMPVPIQTQLLNLLKTPYFYDEPFGAMYCFQNNDWAGRAAISPTSTVSRLWRLMFEHTVWQDDTPDVSSTMQYPWCAGLSLACDMRCDQPRAFQR